MTRDSEEPSVPDLIVELRETLGMFSGTMSKSPKLVWEEALTAVRRLTEERRITIVVHPDDWSEALVALVAEFDGAELVVSKAIDSPGKAYVIRRDAVLVKGSEIPVDVL